jgi:hypothetical protein
MGGANNTQNWRKVADIVERKAIPNCQSSKPTIVTSCVFPVSFRRSGFISSFRFTLSNMNGNKRLYYSTNTNGNSMSTAGDSRNTSTKPTGNDVNEEANNIKKKLLFLISFVALTVLKQPTIK